MCITTCQQTLSHPYIYIYNLALFMFIPYGTGLYLCAQGVHSNWDAHPATPGVDTSFRHSPWWKKKNHMGLEEDSGGDLDYLDLENAWTFTAHNHIKPHKTTVSYWSGGDLKMATNNIPSGYVKIAIENGPVEIVVIFPARTWWIFP